MRRGSVHFLLPMGAIQNDAGYEDRGHRRGIELPIVGHPFPQDGIVQPGDIPQAQFRSIAIVQPSHGRPHGFESFRAKRQTATDRGRDRLSPTPPSGRVGDWRAGLEQFSIKSKHLVIASEAKQSSRTSGALRSPGLLLCPSSRGRTHPPVSASGVGGVMALDDCAEVGARPVGRR